MFIFHEVSPRQADNRAALAEGVKGVRCKAAASAAEVLPLIEQDQLEALAHMDNTLMKMENIGMGTIEVYENGALNVYIKRDRQVVGYMLYRRDS